MPDKLPEYANVVPPLENYAVPAPPVRATAISGWVLAMVQVVAAVPLLLPPELLTDFVLAVLLPFPPQAENG